MAYRQRQCGFPPDIMIYNEESGNKGEGAGEDYCTRIVIRASVAIRPTGTIVQLFHTRCPFLFLRLIESSIYTTHCRSCNQFRAAVSNTTKSPSQLCSGHSLAMCCAVWSVAPHSHDADGDSPIRFMVDLNLP